MKQCTIILLVCLLLTGCGKSGPVQNDKTLAEETEILMTVDGREVPVWRYLCWLRYASRQVEAQYAAAGQAVDWDLPIDGMTLAELVKQQALKNTVLYATVENRAEQYGCTAPQGSAPAEPLPLPGLTEAQAQELQRVGLLYAALYELYCTEGSPLAPGQERLDAFAKEADLMTLDRILIAAGEDRETARQRTAELFSRLNSAADPAQMFSALAAEGDDRAGPRQSSNCGWEETLLEAARSLEVGQCSGILETAEGFSVLMRLEPALSEIKEAHFDALLLQAAEAAKVTTQPLYEELDPAELVAEETEKPT